MRKLGLASILVLALIGGFGGGSAGAAPSAAFTNVSTSPDPTEGKALTLTIDGYATGKDPSDPGNPFSAWFDLYQGSPTCGKDPDTTVNNAGVRAADTNWSPVQVDSSGHFHLTFAQPSDVGMTVETANELAAGKYVACVWLTDSEIALQQTGASLTVAQASRSFSIRLPHYRLSLRGPRTLKLHDYLTATDYNHLHFGTFVARAWAEVPQQRRVQIAVEPHGTRHCPTRDTIVSPWSNTDAGGPAYRPESEDQGFRLKAGTHDYRFRIAVERQDGGWRPPDRVLVCGAIFDELQMQEQSGFVRPEAIAHSWVTVKN